MQEYEQQQQDQQREKVSLGDAVYAEISNDVVVLTTWDGQQTTNTIYLEHGAMERLIAYYNTSVRPTQERRPTHERKTL